MGTLSTSQKRIEKLVSTDCMVEIRHVKTTRSGTEVAQLQREPKYAIVIVPSTVVGFSRTRYYYLLGTGHTSDTNLNL